MKTSIQTKLRSLQRLLYTAAALLMFSSGLPLIYSGTASAAQMSSRSIQMSDSGKSGTSITTGVGSGTNVTYRVSFTTAASASSMVINFCQEDPIINDTCTTPTGFVGPTGISSVTGNIGGWTRTVSGGEVKLDDTGGSNAATAGAQVFDLTGVTNPSSSGTFFARMYTYSNNTFGTYSSATSIGNYVDYGGIALAITNTITITARVQEQLTFCVTKADHSTWTTSHDCSDPAVGTNLPAVTLGHGSPTPVLDANTVDTSSIYTQMSTNATSGAVINMRNSNLTCGGLSADNGTTCAIPAINSGSGAGASAMTAGTAGFGLFVSASTLDVNGVGTITPSPAYHDSSHTTVPTDVWFGMDTTTSNNNVTSTFGSTIASCSAPVYRVDNVHTFAATSALTTPAGIYTANLSMIATGTF